MTNNNLGTVRRSNIIMTHGPGALADFRVNGKPVSGIIAELGEWDLAYKRMAKRGALPDELIINEIRLQKKLGVKEFRLPPVDYENEDGESLKAVRFPTWLQCPKCNKIAPANHWKPIPGRAYKICARCSNESGNGHDVFVVPVRFIMACEDGHIDEFPWHYWINHKEECPNRNRYDGELKLEQTKEPGLAGLILSCPKCGAWKSMEGIFNVSNWKGYHCRGRSPWLLDGTNRERKECNKQPRVLQRGATNLYYPYIVSALTIPPWSDRIWVELGYHGPQLLDVIPEMLDYEIHKRYTNELKEIMERLDIKEDELKKIIVNRRERLGKTDVNDLKSEEYRQFISTNIEDPEEKQEFEIRKTPLPEELKPYLRRVRRVVRLREVRAIRGFTRINPPGNENSAKLAPISSRHMNWLPAIEVRGEGIFMELNPDRLKAWEEKSSLVDRAKRINDRWVKDFQTRYNGEMPELIITPRYLLVHTFAHAIMRQLTLDCGYSSASLRERLYVSNDDNQMAGLLIYTTTSDSDGTLGGLQRQGKKERISNVIFEAIKSMRWCSSDPLCIYDMTSVSDNFSLAACHSCCLAPETSCENFNRFLDRATLIGLPEEREAGYFSDMFKGE